MKEDVEFNKLSPEEKLKVENELLRLKLETEFGMTGLGSTASDKINNEWLNYVYSFEKQFAENKQIKIYDLIGRPAFKKTDEIEKELVTFELNRLTEIMKSSSIRLDTICDYDDEIIYRFITEELFEQETDDIRIPGMMHCYTYEEFHPNHQYDIEKMANEFIVFLINKNWDDFMINMLVADTISLDEVLIERKRFFEIIKSFQSKNKKRKLMKFDIQSTAFDPEKGSGQLDGFIKYKSDDSKEISEGRVHFEFVMDYGYWSISKVVIPGFNGGANSYVL